MRATLRIGGASSFKQSPFGRAVVFTLVSDP